MTIMKDKFAGLLILFAVATLGLVAYGAPGSNASLRKLQGNSGGNNGNRGDNGPDEDGSCPKSNAPVCVDDETYQNACLAIAQGETDYTMGPCRGEHLHFRGSDLRISKADMEKFNQEGFKLVGQVENKDVGPPEWAAVDDDQGEGESDPNPGQEKKLARTTPNGFKYVAKDHKPRPVDPEAQGNHPDFGDNKPPGKPGAVDPEEGDDAGEARNLQIGTDTRVHISNTGVYPYWRLGEVDWSGSEGGCSGSIIGTNKVLTAAHCVFDTYYNQWQVPSHFAPGRKRKCTQQCFIWCWTSCSTEEPWGRWPVEYATLSTSFINAVPPGPGLANSGTMMYDVAILTMGTNWAGEIGNYMGKMPIIERPCTIDTGSQSAGYPASKADGQMWSTGNCDWWESNACSDRVISNTCDVTGGQSGSAVYDSSKRIFGVAVAAGSTRSYMYGFDSYSKTYVPAWGG